MWTPGGRLLAVTGNAGARWRVVTKPPRHGSVGAREQAGTCGHWALWAAGKRAPTILTFL
jgi:hypothetical protein